MNVKVLSIIVPAYNMEAYISKCLSSLIVTSELLNKLEVIVVNDGSKDRTSELAKEFAVKWPQTFKVIDKENGHYGSCVNAALPVVKGYYVRILDSDDSVDKENFSEFLLKLVSWCRLDTPPDMIVADHCTVNESDDIISRIHYSLPVDRFISPNEIRNFTQDSIGVQAVVHRTGNLREIRYRQIEGSPYTDTQWSLEPIVGVRSVAYFPKVITRYLFGREGQTMEPIQFTRNAAKQANVSLELYRRFAEVSKHPMPLYGEYYRSCVRANMHWVYSLFVFGYGGLYPDDDGGWFDQEVQRILPDLSRDVENTWKTVLLHFHWLREWRRNGYSRKSLKFIAYFLLHAVVGTIRNTFSF